MRPHEEDEAKRVLALTPEAPQNLKRYTCFGCAGALIKLDATTSKEQRESFARHNGFDPNCKTLCAFAWDPYNTDGDCLDSK